MKIGYFADGEWGHRAFKKIIKDESLSIEFICVRNNTNDQTFKRYSKYYNVDYLSDKNINSSHFLNKVKKYNCDLFVSMSFNQIFKYEIINIPRLKSINCHAGNLPFYRGRNVLNWVLINDEKQFGITVHYIDEGIDTGDIITQKTYSISDKDNYQTLLEKSYDKCPQLLYQSIKSIQENKVSRIEQSSVHATGFYCSRRKKGDEKIDWNNPSREIFNFVRAICKPGPQARSFHDGNEIKINKAELISSAPSYIGIPGTVLQVDNNQILIKTQDSFIRIVEWTALFKVKTGIRLN